jgi:Flp pilus assembly protein TadD
VIRPGRGAGTAVRPARGAAAIALPAALLAASLLAGCSGDGSGDAATATDPATRAQMLVNAGNQAYHAGDFNLAARRYAAAAVVRKDDPVAYFGLGMALTKLGRDEDARAAYQRARELTQKRKP